MQFIKIKNNEYLFGCDGVCNSIDSGDVISRVEIYDIFNKKRYKLGYIFEEMLFERLFANIDTKDKIESLMRDLIKNLLLNDLILHNSLDVMFDSRGFKETAKAVMNCKVSPDVFMYQIEPEKFFDAITSVKLFKKRFEHDKSIRHDVTFDEQDNFQLN